jgi:sodium-dependent phosphate cotransporter
MTALRRVVVVLLLLFVFLLGIKGLGAGFKHLGGDLLDTFFTATRNPFVGLVVGILATTLVQSSSVTTSMIVGLVAAPGTPLPFENAIPMIMGANIGTTVTNTVVSLGHMTRQEEFRSAFAVATCHDFFNYITVLVLLPLEMATGFLRRLATLLGSGLSGVEGVTYKSPIKVALGAVLDPIEAAIAWLFPHETAQAVVLIGLSGAMIVVALFLLVRVMRQTMQTRVESFISRVLGGSAVFSMVMGVVVTVMVQSSSITTSLLVPLAGAGLITLEQAFPITLGANVGTTITALLASLAVSGPNAHFGVEIALVHLFFNLTGILLVYPWRRVRQIPLRAASGLAGYAVHSRKWALAYVVGLFYVLPAVFIFVHRAIS